MHTPDDSRNHVDSDIDARLAAQSLRPGADFADSVFARIETESLGADPALDRLLASSPRVVSPGFADRVMASVAAERRRRRFVLWGAPMGVAACLALACAAFLRPADNADVRLARLLSEDAELKALCTYAPGSHESQLEGDLAALMELGAAEFTNESNESVS